VMNEWIGLCFSDGEARLFILLYIRFILSHFVELALLRESWVAEWVG
jgi:hypothetical protein